MTYNVFGGTLNLTQSIPACMMSAFDFDRLFYYSCYDWPVVSDDFINCSCLYKSVQT